MKLILALACALLLPAALALPQAPAPAPAAETPTFTQASASAQQRLEASLAELSALRAAAAEETIPLTRELRQLEDQLATVRGEFQETSRLLDSRTLDLANLQTQIRTREEQASYLSTLMGEFVRTFETRLHITELQRHEAEIDEAKLAAENTALSPGEVLARQASLLEVSLRRLEQSMGGARFAGTAVDAEGRVLQGDFLVLGPYALFASREDDVTGTAEQRLGSLEPTVIEFAEPAHSTAAAAAVRGGSTVFPLDPTMGNAHRVEATEETFAEHVSKGGPVMIPIFALAGLSLLIALAKWLSFLFIASPTPGQLRGLLAAVARGDKQDAVARATAMRKARPPIATGWIVGVVVGGLAGAGLWHLARVDSIATLLPGLFGFFGGQSLPVAIALPAVVLGALELGLRFVLGYSPTGRMLEAGVEHLEYPPDLVEEVMYERVLAARIKLDSYLALIAMAAAAAPLLGLLGTVTGIINTFKLITVFGSGDVKTLSGGISEALITTEFGLIAAIPALLIHGLLSRKARKVADGMEKAAVALVNQLAKTPYVEAEPQKPGAPEAATLPAAALSRPAPPATEPKAPAPEPPAAAPEPAS